MEFEDGKRHTPFKLGTVLEHKRTKRRCVVAREGPIPTAVEVVVVVNPSDWRIVEEDSQE